MSTVFGLCLHEPTSCVFCPLSLTFVYIWAYILCLLSTVFDLCLHMSLHPASYFHCLWPLFTYEPTSCVLCPLSLLLYTWAYILRLLSNVFVYCISYMFSDFYYTYFLKVYCFCLMLTVFFYFLCLFWTGFGLFLLYLSIFFNLPKCPLNFGG